MITGQAHSEVAHIAVASNFIKAMKAIKTDFQQSTGHELKLSFGSSGKIYAQIKHGAPFHAFLSADQAMPEALEKDGLVLDNSRFTYAIGTLVLWSPLAGFVDEKANRLKSGQFKRLALANPKLAPYGQAAVQVLERLKLNHLTKRKWVRGENIAQTYQFISTQNADIGFVALSQVVSNGSLKNGSAWIVPQNLYGPIRQDAVLLSKGKNNIAAHALMSFIRSNKGKKIIGSYGYKTIDSGLIPRF